MALSNPNLETLPKESPIKSTSGTSELTNDMKSWILNSTDSGDDEKISEVIDKSKHSTLSTNSYYAKLKFDQYVLKSMEIKDENAIKEFKSVMESVIKSNRDYNPRLANDEYKKLLADYQLLNSSKKEKQPKNDEDVSVDNGEIFGDLFAQSNEPSVTSNTSLVLRDMSYKSWSGKNPKQYLVDYLSKNAKGTRAFFTILENGPGFRCKVLLSGGDKLVDGLKAEMDEKVATLREAEYYAATKVLFLLIPHLSVNLVLPNPYRILWSELLQNQASSVNNSEKTADDLRYEFCSSLVKQKEKIVKVTAAAKLFTDNSNSLREEANAKQSIFKALVENYPQRISCDSYMELLSSRKTLPVYAHRESVISAINSNAITLISGETGSGYHHLILVNLLKSLNLF